MNNPFLMLDQEVDVATPADSELRPCYRDDIARVLNLINLDSESAPRRYLEEAKVPHGGE
jgi:hypothetical protein